MKMMRGTDVSKLVKSLKSTYNHEEIAQILECDVDSVRICMKADEPKNDKVGKVRLRTMPMEPTRREVGRPKVFENRKLVEQLLAEHPQYTSIDVQRELLSRHGIEVSRRTLQRRISEIKTAQFQLRNGSLTPEVKQRRMEWARAHEDWTVQDWRNIFNMDDYKVLDGKTPKEIYVDTLVGPISPDCNDLNLLELLVAIIEPKIKTQPANVSEFRAVLYEIWHSDADMVSKMELLYESMPWRVATVLQNGGAETGFC
ncbi:uncharacterized protein LOC132786077 [Drosophila nasuta]|uniref:Uncharacterized protein LOC117575412 n=1 Tax=Drosophila albomicans TaxID=7291 RepID=A0A6P8XQU9_DROAB|nr:uncharacterized protein LOC117575412 [Drosophila albomicans]XP_060648449.1 uncharacterized protein LOC132786077 [Drosophila nasuta]